MMVIGELAPKGQSLAGLDTDDTPVIPISTAFNRVIGRNPANPRAISGVIIKVRDGGNMALAFTEIRQVVCERHGLLPAQEERFSPDQPNGGDAGEGGFGAGARDSACCYRVRVAPGWRDWHHEHHLGQSPRGSAKSGCDSRLARGEMTSWANSWSRRRYCP